MQVKEILLACSFQIIQTSSPPHPCFFFFFLVFSQLLLVSFPIYYGIPICIYYKCSYIKTIIILTENYAHNWKILEFAFVFLTLLKYS